MRERGEIVDLICFAQSLNVGEEMEELAVHRKQPRWLSVVATYLFGLGETRQFNIFVAVDR